MSEAPAVPSKLMVIIPGLRDSTMRSVVDRVRRERGDYRVEFVPHGIKVFSRTRTLAKSVAELAHKMALACAADGWVAGHVAHRIQVDREADRFHPEPRAGEHGKSGFGNHRHVDQHAIALTNTQAAHDGRHAHYLGF